MDEPAVTLIVKAPNQQVEDETVRCGRSWTVGALKRHLSEVYPGRPAPHDQKLIYSGQLLGDSAVLGEVLRRYDGHDTHTVHLVCAPQPGGAPRQGPAGAPQAGGAPGVPPDVCAQYLLMQQAYFQYMTHYMNLYASAANQTPPGTTPNPPGPPPPQPPADPDAAPQRRNDAVAAPPPAEPEEERELLDVAYTVGRIVLFSAIMYYYSSPLRYLFVLFLGVCLYVYRMGLFRAAAAAANNNNVAPAAGAADEPAAPTRLAVAWTFFTAFFASLIPEIPNVV